MNFGVKVELTNDFAVIRETLTRMGIANKDDKIITPSCYIWKEKGEYYVCHFKELLSMFDTFPKDLVEKDKNRRDAICTLMQNWGLVELIDTGAYQSKLKEPIFVLTHEEKKYYTFNHKFKYFNKLAILRGEKWYE